MKTILAILVVFLPAGFAAGARAQSPLGTAFTYQGELKQGGLPFNGTADLHFKLFDALTAGNQIGSEYVVAGAAVTQGIFTATIDFGPGAFGGSARWLEVGVQAPGDAGATTLAPRQALTPAPYALYALAGPAGGGSGPWALNGTTAYYAGGPVAIGTNVAGAELSVATGTANINPVFITSNNSSYAAFAVENSGANGVGIYDPTSARHYLAGSLGLGTLTPGAHLDATGTGGIGIRSTMTGQGLLTTTEAAVQGVAVTGGGISGRSATGVLGTSDNSYGVLGQSGNGFGVEGDNSAVGTYGQLGGKTGAVIGYSPSAGVPAATFTNAVTGGTALVANGLAQVKTLQILGADLAESFPVAGGGVAPGTVLAIDADGSGQLRICDEAYSPRVAGVASGANGLDAAVVLKGKGFDEPNHVAVALSGRVWVRCDATHGPIRVGDLLTSGERAGVAMRAADPARSTGAILGKAMTSLETGTGLVLVLVSLR